MTPEHPVFVNRFDRTMFLANSLALKLANVTEYAESTERRNREGRVWQAHRSPQGQRRRSRAQGHSADSFEQRLVQVRAVLREAREGGVTTMQDLTSADQLRAAGIAEARRADRRASCCDRPTT